MAIDGPNSFLLSTLLSGVAYGLFVVLYGIILYIMFVIRKPSQSRKSAAMIIVTIMLLISTAHLAISFVRTRIAVIDLADDPTAAVTFILSPSTVSYMVQDTLYAVQTLMGDAFLVYRLYIVYSQDKRVLGLAGFLYFGSAVTTIGALVNEGIAGTSATVFQLKAWITSFVSLTLSTNFICTSAIALRLWIVENRVKRMKSDRNLTRTAIIVIESGAIYSVFLISLLTTYIIGDFSLYVPFFLLPQIIGITFSLVMIRIGLGLSVGDTSLATKDSDITGVPKSGRSIGNSLGMVRITRVREVEYDESYPDPESLRKTRDLEFDQTTSQSSIGLAISKNGDHV